MLKSFFCFALLTFTICSYGQSTLVDPSKDIDTHIDEFTDQIIRNSPKWEYPSGLMNEVVFYSVQKINSKVSVPEYFIELRLHSDKYEIPGRGVILLFDDGSTTKFSKPDATVKIDYDEETKSWKYYSSIKLTVSELNMFISKPIYKFRLFMFDEGVPVGKRKIYQMYAKAIKNK